MTGDRRRERPRVPPDSTTDALLHLEARIDGDVVQLSSHAWAIHGVIPVDGEVILAEFDDDDRARAALEQLHAAEQAHTDDLSSGASADPPGVVDPLRPPG